MLNKIIKTTLFQNAGIYTITSIFNAAIPFLLLPILTRYMTPEEYGLVSMFTLLLAFTNPFVGLSVNGAIARQYYNSEEIDIWKYVGNCIVILLSSTLIVGTIFYIFSGLISELASFPAKMLWMVIIVSLCKFLTDVVLTIFQVKKMPSHHSFFNISKTLLNSGLSIFLVVVIRLSWQGRIYGQLISFIVFAFIAIIILMKNKWIKLEYNKKYITNALKFGIPLIPHALAGSIISMTDRFFITNMIGLGETGLYTLGYQIGSIINIFAISFNKAYVPWLFERLKANNNKTKVKIVKFTYLYFIIISFTALVLGVTAPYFITIFTGEAFGGSSIYVVWIAMGYAFNGMYLMVVNYIFYSEKTHILAMITFFTATLNVILNYFFINIFGSIGAAQATTITYFIKFILVWYLCAKVYKMPWNFLGKFTKRN